ncbi:hypothetical protein GCM10010987_11890 [Bradyrhizobium guangdongense]|nr:hypothetical protein GCM10010987_11890 [Bradyrhizobium guangdongense]
MRVDLLLGDTDGKNQREERGSAHGDQSVATVRAPFAPVLSTAVRQPALDVPGSYLPDESVLIHAARGKHHVVRVAENESASGTELRGLVEIADHVDADRADDHAQGSLLLIEQLARELDRPLVRRPAEDRPGDIEPVVGLPERVDEVLAIAEIERRTGIARGGGEHVTVEADQRELNDIAARKMRPVAPGLQIKAGRILGVKRLHDRQRLIDPLEDPLGILLE